MIPGNLKKRAPIVALLALLAGCSSAPYVFNPNEFNRDAEVFRTGILDRLDVTICYARRRSQDAEVSRLADQECRRFGKRASFLERTLQVCPLATPFGAKFACVSDRKRVSELNR